jgi:hypothetical protein
MDEVAVDLTDADDAQIRMEEVPAPPVLGDGIGSVADPSGEIESSEGARANAAGASAETMDETGDVPSGTDIRTDRWINVWRDWLGGRHWFWFARPFEVRCAALTVD